ncbi:MAG: sigma-70 family RNA polymerase sigma factor [Nitrospirota bacterium]|nr:sigma-70 family RNA polymerase sigma factor [Nitrospirota bacterium]
MKNGTLMEEDINLLDRFAAGDREAFNDLVRKYQKPLYSLLFRMVSDHDDAADLLQKTLVKAFTGAGGFERRSSFKTWLYQIAINLAKNLYRDRARLAQVPIDDVVISRDPGTVDALIRKQARQRLHQAMVDLPEKQRLTVMLRVQQQKSFAEISAILGCSLGTAKANYHHGVRKLKVSLADAVAVPEKEE